MAHGSPGVPPPSLVPPLGILHIAASLRRARPSDVIEIADAVMDLQSAGDISPLVESFGPDIVGISGMSKEALNVASLARTSRAARPDVPVIIGGPVASAFPLGVLEHMPEADIAAIGEGEETIIDIVSCIEAGGDLMDVRGLALRRPDGSLTRTPPRPFIESLDDLPSIDWSEVDLGTYNRMAHYEHIPSDPGGHIPMLTSRGCPYRCSYCHKFFGNKVRALSARALVDDMERINRQHGIREFHFVDDIFNHRRGRVMEFCRELESRGLDVRYAFPNGLRGDLLTKEEIEALAATGAYFTALAIETVTPRLQKMISKNLDVDRVFQNAERATDRGILTRAFVMLGFPTETLEEMENTISRTIDSAFLMAKFCPVTPYPGTELFDIAVEHGFDPGIWATKKFSHDMDFVNISTVSDEDFQRLLHEVRYRFHSPPERRARLRAWIESNGLTDHPYIKSTGFWRMVFETDEGMVWAAPQGLEEPPVHEAVEPLPQDLTQGAELAGGWAIESVKPGTHAHEVKLVKHGSDPVMLFFTPRDESSECMTRAGAWNIGLISETHLETVPRGLEEAVRDIAGRIENDDHQ